MTADFLVVIKLDYMFLQNSKSTIYSSYLMTHVDGNVLLIPDSCLILPTIIPDLLISLSEVDVYHTIGGKRMIKPIRSASF